MHIWRDLYWEHFFWKEKKGLTVPESPRLLRPSVETHQSHFPTKCWYEFPLASSAVGRSSGCTVCKHTTTMIMLFSVPNLLTRLHHLLLWSRRTVVTTWGTYSTVCAPNSSLTLFLLICVYANCRCNIGTYLRTRGENILDCTHARNVTRSGVFLEATSISRLFSDFSDGRHTSQSKHQRRRAFHPIFSLYVYQENERQR